MKIEKYSRCFRYYGVNVNGKRYKVENIHFYDNDSVIVSTGQGWLSTSPYGSDLNDIESIELPVEQIKLKRKLKFDGTVFIMIVKDYFGDSVAELYIPADMLEIRFSEHKIHHKWVYAIYEGAQGIRIGKIVKFLDKEMNRIRNEYEETYKQVSDTKLSVHKSEEVLANIDKLKELAEAYIAERKRVHDLTIEDIEL